MQGNTNLIRATRPTRNFDGEVVATKQERKRSERERQAQRAQQRAEKRGE